MKRKIGVATITLVLTLSTNTLCFAPKSNNFIYKTLTESLLIEKIDWQAKYFGSTPSEPKDGIEKKLKIIKGENFSPKTLHVRNTKKTKKRIRKSKWHSDKIVLQNIKIDAQTTIFKAEENQIKQLDFNRNEIKDEISSAFILKKMEDLEVENIRWKLIELNGNPIKENAASHYLIFHSIDGNLEAKAGCNEILCKYEIKKGSKLILKTGISTQMGCPEGNIETEFKKALFSANNISINNKTLSLNKDKMAPLARFEFAANLENNWFIGKTFIQQPMTTNNGVLPKMAFLKFKTKTSVSLKIGNVISRMTATIKENQIILKGKSLETKFIFSVINNEYLQDENGVKWIPK